VLHGAAAEIGIKALAVLCRQAVANGGNVDESTALRSVLQHIGATLPCSAADPFPQGHGFDRDATACSKCRKDYELAPFCHSRPVTKERPGGDADVRRQAAKRVMGSASILGQMQLYTELETQEVTGASLATLQIVMCTNFTPPLPPSSSGPDEARYGDAPCGQLKCEITTDRFHGYQAGYLLTMSIKGIEVQNRVHNGPKRVIEVTGPLTYVVEGQVPKKISGASLNSLFGRSKVSRINGSFVTDIDWVAQIAALRAIFAAKKEALTNSSEAAAFVRELSLLIHSATAAQEEVLSKCTAVYDAPGEVSRLRRHAVCKTLGVDLAAGSASHTAI